MDKKPKDQAIRDGVRLIKERFHNYKTPSLETPADSVIEECVRIIYEDGFEAGRIDKNGKDK